MNKFYKGKNSNDLSSKYSVNEKIKGDQVFVIDHEGNNLGEVAKSKALTLAETAGLDLVQVGEKNSNPVTKIMDFGKFLYAKKKQLSDAKKHQKTMQLKEVKLRPNIDDQDYKTKLRRAEQFFREGKKVKFTLQFKGRQISMMSTIGPNIFNRITQDLAEKDLGSLVEEKEQRGRSYWSKTYFIKTK